MLLSLSKVIFVPRITSVLFVTGTELSRNIPAALRCTAGDRHAVPSAHWPMVSPELPVPVVVSARALHCWQHQVLLGTRNEALIYMSKCGFKGLTTGYFSTETHTAAQQAFFLKKSPLICKIISIEAAEAKQISLYFLLP